jgi:hypothetical protein
MVRRKSGLHRELMMVMSRPHEPANFWIEHLHKPDVELGQDIRLHLHGVVYSPLLLGKKREGQDAEPSLSFPNKPKIVNNSPTLGFTPI